MGLWRHTETMATIWLPFWSGPFAGWPRRDYIWFVCVEFVNWATGRVERQRSERERKRKDLEGNEVKMNLRDTNERLVPRLSLARGVWAQFRFPSAGPSSSFSLDLLSFSKRSKGEQATTFYVTGVPKITRWWTLLSREYIRRAQTKKKKKKVFVLARFVLPHARRRSSSSTQPMWQCGRVLPTVSSIWRFDPDGIFPSPSIGRDKRRRETDRAQSVTPNRVVSISLVERRNTSPYVYSRVWRALMWANESYLFAFFSLKTDYSFWRSPFQLWYLPLFTAGLTGQIVLVPCSSCVASKGSFCFAHQLIAVWR